MSNLRIVDTACNEVTVDEYTRDAETLNYEIVKRYNERKNRLVRNGDEESTASEESTESDRAWIAPETKEKKKRIAPETKEKKKKKEKKLSGSGRRIRDEEEEEVTVFLLRNG